MPCAARTAPPPAGPTRRGPRAILCMPRTVRRGACPFPRAARPMRCAAPPVERGARSIRCVPRLTRRGSRCTPRAPCRTRCAGRPNPCAPRTTRCMARDPGRARAAWSPERARCEAARSGHRAMRRLDRFAVPTSHKPSREHARDDGERMLAMMEGAPAKMTLSPGPHSSGRECRVERDERPFQCRQFISNDPAHRGGIHVEVVMNKMMSRADDRGPGYFRMCVPGFRGELFRCLADDLKQLPNGQPGLCIAIELVLGTGTRDRPDPGDGIQHMLHPHEITRPAAHRSSACPVGRKA